MKKQVSRYRIQSRNKFQNAIFIISTLFHTFIETECGLSEPLAGLLRSALRVISMSK